MLHHIFCKVGFSHLLSSRVLCGYLHVLVVFFMVVQRFAKTTSPPVSERVRKSYGQGLSPTRQMCSPKMRNFYNCRNEIGIPLQRQPTFKVVSHPLFNCGLCHLQERNSPPIVRLRFQSGACQQKKCFTTTGGSTRKTFYRFHFFPTR